MGVMEMWDAKDKIHNECSMKSRGGVVIFEQGKTFGFDYCGDKKQVETCLALLALIYTEGIKHYGERDDERLILNDIRDEIINDMDKFKKTSKKELDTTKAFTFKDNGDEIAEFIVLNARPRDKNGLFMYAMINGSHVRIMAPELSVSDSLWNKMMKRDREAAECIMSKFAAAIYALIGNYLAAYTTFTKKAVNDFFKYIHSLDNEMKRAPKAAIDATGNILYQ